MFLTSTFRDSFGHTARPSLPPCPPSRFSNSNGQNHVVQWRGSITCSRYDLKNKNKKKKRQHHIIGCKRMVLAEDGHGSLLGIAHASVAFCPKCRTVNYQHVFLRRIHYSIYEFLGSPCQYYANIHCIHFFYSSSLTPFPCSTFQKAPRPKRLRVSYPAALPLFRSGALFLASWLQRVAGYEAQQCLHGPLSRSGARTAGEVVRGSLAGRRPRDPKACRGSPPARQFSQGGNTTQANGVFDPETRISSGG